MRRKLAALFAGAAMALTACAMAIGAMEEPAMAAVLRSGFQSEKVASGVTRPIALGFTPDGRMLVATQSGQLRMYKNDALLQTPALDISGRVCSNAERGLLGVAVDPNFSTNKYVYAFYTYMKHGVCPAPNDPSNPDNPVNRVSRFVMNGDTVDPATEKVLVDNIPSIGNHNAGDLRFGKDGFLYITVGDGSCDYAGDSPWCGGGNDASRDTHVLLGKVLRVTRDGNIPATNPYTGTNSARCNLTGRTEPGKNCQETFASGLRNPFRFAFDPDASGTRFFVNDVGQNAWEEFDEGKAGADYAWNLCEGNHDNPARPGSVDCTSAPYTPPVHEYSHDATGCSSVTGSAFVPNEGAFPASYDDSYLFGDYVCNKIMELKPKSGGGYAMSDFASGLAGGGPIAMAFGPSGSGQALYYTTYANGGEIHRITYTGTANQVPVASVKTTSPDYGAVPLSVSFDGSGSRDPDGDALTYLWDFGDGSTAQTASPTTTHTYTTVPAGSYAAELTVRDARGAVSTPATVKVFPGDSPPQPTIASPTPTKLFRVGEQITLSGSATDPEDGQLADSALSWEVRRHHNGSHWHPLLLQTGNDLTITAPPPEDLHATGAGNYLEIRLTATDSRGLSRTVSQELQPRRMDLAFQSNPSGLTLQANGTSLTTPRTLRSWEGYKLTLNAPSPQTLSGKTHVFSSWSDGKGQQHDIFTGAASSVYTVTFKACTKTGTTGADMLDGTAGADVICGMGGNDAIRGLAGDDTLEGMEGDDTLRGGGGADKVKGAAGADSLYGEDGNDALDSKDGVNGNDSLDGGWGTDTKLTDTTERSVVGFP